MTDASVATSVAVPTFTDDELALLVDGSRIVQSLGILPTDPAMRATLDALLDRIQDYLDGVGYTGDAGAGATIADLFTPGHPDYLGGPTHDHN